MFSAQSAAWPFICLDRKQRLDKLRNRNSLHKIVRLHRKRISLSKPAYRLAIFVSDCVMKIEIFTPGSGKLKDTSCVEIFSEILQDALQGFSAPDILNELPAPIPERRRLSKRLRPARFSRSFEASLVDSVS
jgi:hypothetical protein